MSQLIPGIQTAASRAFMNLLEEIAKEMGITVVVREIKKISQDPASPLETITVKKKIATFGDFILMDDVPAPVKSCIFNTYGQLMEVSWHATSDIKKVLMLRLIWDEDHVLLKRLEKSLIAIRDRIDRLKLRT